MDSTAADNSTLDEVGGLPATGRRLRGPASDLVELDGANGLKHTAIVFHPEYRDHNAINDALQVVRGFLESPWVTGLVELVGHDPANGAFIYPTGQSWSVAEIIRQLADLGEQAGVRAGLELMYAAGQILVEAAETGESQGVYSHGGLTPWRVMIRKDGQVEIIGYALPQVEILNFHEDAGRVPREDSFRYCPPERIDAQAEDISSDLFGLSLIAFELMTGKPVYDGLVNDIRQKAARGECSRRLFRFRDHLPQSVRDLLTRAMRPERPDRFEDGQAFLEAVRRVLSGHDAKGISLMDLMRKLSTQQVRTGARPESASTMMGTPEDFRKMLGEDADELLEDAPAQGGARAWSPPPRRRAPPRQDAPEPAAPALAAGASADAPAPARAGAAAGPQPAEESPRRWSAPTGRRRAPRRAASVEDAAPAAPAAQPEVAEAPSPVAAALRSSRVSAVRRGRNPGPASVIPGEVAAAEDLEAPRAAPEPVPRRGGDAPRVPPSAPRRAPRAPQHPPAASTAPAGPASQPAADPALERASERASRPASSPAAPAPGSPVAAEAASARLRTSTADLLQRIRASSSTPIPRGDLRRSDAGATPAGDAARAPDRCAEGDAHGRAEGDAPAAPPRRAPRRPKRAPPSAARAPAGAGPASASPSPFGARADPASEETRLRPPGEDGEPARVPAAAAAAAPVPEPSSGTAVAPASAPAASEAASEASGLLPAARTPDPIPSTASSRETARYAIRRGPGGRSFRMRLPATLSVAEAVCWLVGNRVPVRTNLAGGLAGWWRLDQAGAALSPDAPMGAADADQELHLRFVPNRSLQAEFIVEHGAPPARFVAPVGSAVPVATLVDHLADWLQLPAGDWRLDLDGAALSPWSILEDHPRIDAFVAGGARARLALRPAARPAQEKPE